MRVGEFYKVSFQRFDMDNATQIDSLEIYEDIKLPSRATEQSAGYDFVAPYGFKLNPGEEIKIPTGIRVKIDKDWCLMCVPRSSVGFKYGVRLANTIAVIDADYFDSNNEGHIFLKFINGGNEVFEVHKGDRIAQGVFLPYGVTYSDDSKGVRNGGIGSTGTK